MAIIDGIAKGMSDAVKKTGELTEAAKLRYALHSERAKLSKCFEKIGRLYYSYLRNGKDTVSQIAVLLGEADESREKITLLKKQLAESQNKSLCPKCGNVVDEDSSFCPGCGTRLTEDEPVADEW